MLDEVREHIAFERYVEHREIRAGNLAAERAPAQYRTAARAAAAIGAVAASVETFGWMTRHPGHPLARALAKPGHELQHRMGTREPTPEQLEVAEAALNACLQLEDPGLEG